MTDFGVCGGMLCRLHGKQAVMWDDTFGTELVGRAAVPDIFDNIDVYYYIIALPSRTSVSHQLHGPGFWLSA